MRGGFSGAQLSVSRTVWHSPDCDDSLRWEFVQLSSCELLCLVPAGMSLLSVPVQMFLIPAAPGTEHSACGQLLPLSHVFLLPNDEGTRRISGSGEDLV